jgi:hypothetical protein
MDVFKLLLRDSRFWAAVLALLNAIIFFFVPTFPTTIWVAIDGVAAVVLAILATNGSRAQVREARALQAEQE